MGNDYEKPSYWAVLPAAVRYDPKLPPGARLLYAEISSLTDQRGYCFANNEYFQALYGLSDRTVQRHLKALEAGGYIRIVDGDGGQGRRKIFAGINPLLNPDKNVGVTPTKLSPNPDKNVTHNKKENKKEEQAPLKAPRGAGVTAWEPEFFERFWRAYPAEGRKDKASARREWDRLKPDRKLMQTMSAALSAFKASDEWSRGIGIPYACRWLSHHRWEELEEISASVTAAGSAAAEEAAAWI